MVPGSLTSSRHLAAPGSEHLFWPTNSFVSWTAEQIEAEYYRLVFTATLVLRNLARDLAPEAAGRGTDWLNNWPDRLARLLVDGACDAYRVWHVVKAHNECVTWEQVREDVVLMRA